MTARRKLDASYLSTYLAAFALLGLFVGSWASFLAALAVTVGAVVHHDGIRPGPGPRDRRRSGPRRRGRRRHRPRRPPGPAAAGQEAGPRGPGRGRAAYPIVLIGTTMSPLPRP